MKLNVPNMLTILRIIMIPAFVACIIYIEDPIVCGVVSAVIFALTAFTDFLDGYIARKYNQVTDFGKFMDAVADKLMVFGALLAITARFAIEGQKTVNYNFSLANGVIATTNVVAEIMFNVLLWSSIIVFLRELGVTSIRLVCAKTDVGVIPANFFGKAKTVSELCWETVFSTNREAMFGHLKRQNGAVHFALRFPTKVKKVMRNTALRQATVLNAVTDHTHLMT